MFSILNAVVTIAGGFISLFCGNYVLELLVKKNNGDESIICCFIGLFASILLFQIGFIDNFYIKIFSLFLYFSINEIWVPIIFTIMQRILQDKSKISAGSALFMIFENLGGCSGNILVGYLIDTLPFSKEHNVFWSLFPVIISSLLISSVFFYRLHKYYIQLINV